MSRGREDLECNNSVGSIEVFSVPNYLRYLDTWFGYQLPRRLFPGKKSDKRRPVSASPKTIRNTTVSSGSSSTVTVSLRSIISRYY